MKCIIVYAVLCAVFSQLGLASSVEVEQLADVGELKVWVIRDGENNAIVFQCKNGELNSVLCGEGFRRSVLVDQSRTFSPFVLVVLSKNGNIERIFQINTRSTLEAVNDDIMKKYLKRDAELKKAIQESFRTLRPTP